jgi:hypothetical protein
MFEVGADYRIKIERHGMRGVAVGNALSLIRELHHRIRETLADIGRSGCLARDCAVRGEI